jgi:hypothetical protein
VRNYDGVAVGRVAVTRGFANQLPPDVRPKPPGLVRRALIRLGLARARY